MEIVEGGQPGQGGNQPEQGQGGSQPEQGQGGGEGGGAPQPELYELPDGRKVDAATLTREWKDNFLPDYTRKSQELSELKQGNSPGRNAAPSGGDDRWKDPEYRPGSWDEVLGEAENRAYARIKREEAERNQTQTREQQERDRLNQQIDAEVGKIKETDKTLNEEDMFAFAAEKAKKGVQYMSVQSLYEDYKMVENARKQGEKSALQNIQRRAASDVGVGAGGGQGNGSFDLSTIRRGSSIVDAVRERALREGLS